MTIELTIAQQRDLAGVLRNELRNIPLGSLYRDRLEALLDLLRRAAGAR